MFILIWGSTHSFLGGRCFAKQLEWIIGSRVSTIIGSRGFSPPVRWGLLDFMSVVSFLPLPLSFLPSVQCSLPDLHCRDRDHLGAMFPAGPQRRPSELSVPCRTLTATICAQCSLPDLNRDHLRSVFPAGPQPRPSALSVPCRTSTAR